MILGPEKKSIPASRFNLPTRHPALGRKIPRPLRLIIIKLRLTVIKLVKLDNNNFITGVIDTRTPHFTVIEYGRRPRGRVRHVPGHGWEI